MGERRQGNYPGRGACGEACVPGDEYSRDNTARAEQVKGSIIPGQRLPLWGSR